MTNEKVKIYSKVTAIYFLVFGWFCFGLYIYNTSAAEGKLSIKANMKNDSREVAGTYYRTQQLQNSLERLKKHRNRVLFINDIQDHIQKGANPFQEIETKIGRKVKRVSFFSRLYNYFSMIDSDGIALREEVSKVLIEINSNYISKISGLVTGSDFKDKRDIFFMDIKRIKNVRVLRKYVDNKIADGSLSLANKSIISEYKNFKSSWSLRRRINSDFVKGKLNFSREKVANKKVKIFRGPISRRI